MLYISFKSLFLKITLFRHNSLFMKKSWEEMWIGVGNDWKWYRWFIYFLYNLNSYTQVFFFFFACHFQSCMTNRDNVYTKKINFRRKYIRQKYILRVSEQEFCCRYDQSLLSWTENLLQEKKKKLIQLKTKTYLYTTIKAYFHKLSLEHGKFSLYPVI